MCPLPKGAVPGGEMEAEAGALGRPAALNNNPSPYPSPQFLPWVLLKASVTAAPWDPISIHTRAPAPHPPHSPTYAFIINLSLKLILCGLWISVSGNVQQEWHRLGEAMVVITSEQLSLLERALFSKTPQDAHVDCNPELPWSPIQIQERKRIWDSSWKDEAQTRREGFGLGRPRWNLDNPGLDSWPLDITDNE